MTDWAASMQQTFEYYVVDSKSWKDTRLLDKVTSCTITRDSGAETLGSASIDVVDSLDECYVRAYLVIIQNGIKNKYPLATFLIQTPSSSFNGKTHATSIDAYTPLLELKEKYPPLGYFVSKDCNIMDRAYSLANDSMQAPVVTAKSEAVVFSDFIADPDDTMLSFITDLITSAKYGLELDELGRLLFAPKQDTTLLQPVWTFDDSNSSILMPEISLEHDIYGIPNVVEVTYSTDSEYYYARVTNDDSNSPVSTVSRGREIVHRVSNPEITGIPSYELIYAYAESLLKELSSIEYTVTYIHGYCPVRLGDCVRLNYARSNIINIKAKVISQSISCKPGCPVNETAVFTKSLWR